MPVFLIDFDFRYDHLFCYFDRVFRQPASQLLPYRFIMPTNMTENHRLLLGVRIHRTFNNLLYPSIRLQYPATFLRMTYVHNYVHKHRNTSGWIR